MSFIVVIAVPVFKKSFNYQQSVGVYQEMLTLNDCNQFLSSQYWNSIYKVNEIHVIQ
jgi:hypothetical protein